MNRRGLLSRKRTDFDMACSMTGFASAQALVAPFRLVWEVRSVNHRFLEITLRLPGELRSLEPGCRARIDRALTRGKVDCTLTVSRDPEFREGAELREDAIVGLSSLQTRVRQHFPEAESLTVGELLRWPGAVEEPTYDPAALESAVDEALGKALESLVEARQREGQRLTELLLERCRGVTAIIADIRPGIGRAEERYRRRLLERLERFSVDADPQRLEQEMVQLAQRLDIAEEIDRLGSHVSEMESVLSGDRPMGRRLDFLLQELNREANTIASKSQDTELTRNAVELKVLIEQMREQAQNLE